MKLPFLLITLLFSTIIIAQPSTALEENKPTTVDGIELGYRINKESTKKSGGDEYARYVINIYAINKSGCSLRYYLKNNSYTSSYETNEDNLVATFYIRNANGKRLTNTKGTLNAKEWWLPIKTTKKDSDGKDIVVMQDMQAGYIFRKGDQLSNDIIVLVPLGERPKVEVALKYNINMD